MPPRHAHDDRGGTWWTHRYPGVRSDSDLFTYGPPCSEHGHEVEVLPRTDLDDGSLVYR